MAIISPIRRLSPEIKSVLERVSQVIGKPVMILSESFEGDHDWANFRVLGMVDEGVCIAMQQNREEIFGLEAANYQHMTAWDPADGTGLWLHYLRDAKTRAEYRAGPCWY
jgi:hypothetical protein